MPDHDKQCRAQWHEWGGGAGLTPERCFERHAPGLALLALTLHAVDWTYPGMARPRFMACSTELAPSSLMKLMPFRLSTNVGTRYSPGP